MKKLVIAIFILLFSQNIMAQCYSAGQTIPKGYVVASSGNNTLDSIVYSEVNKLERFFKFNVDFFYLMEIAGKNASFNHTCQSNGCVGTVFLGINLLSELFETHGSDAIHVFRATLAHEFGHAVQKLIYWNEGWKRPELHADYMAGYYIGSNYNYTDDQMMSFYAEFFNLGDPYFFDSDHHGTGEERQCAFLEGYYFAKETNTTVETANVYGLQYVAANNPCGVRKYKAAVQQYQNELERRSIQLEKDIRDGNVGSIKFTAKDSKRYKVVTVNGLGQQVTYPINQAYFGLNNFGQQMLFSPISEVIVSPISANTQIPFNIYRSSWFLGDILIFQFTSKICRNWTVDVEFKKRSVSIKNMCY